MPPNKGSESSEVAIEDDAADLDKFDEALMNYDLSDETLEAAPALTAGMQ